MRVGLSILPVLLAVPIAGAQERLELRAEGETGTVLVRAYPQGSEESSPVMQATWRSGVEGLMTFAYQRLAATSASAHVTLDRLVLAGIEQYIDQRVHFQRTGVRTDVSVERMVSDIDAMTFLAADHFPGAQAEGLSEPTRQQLSRVAHIDWSQARFGVDGGQEQDKYLAIYYYVRTQRQELERQLRADLSPLSAVDVLAADGALHTDPGHTIEVPTLCRRVYDEQNFMCALDLTASDTGVALDDAMLSDRFAQDLAEHAEAAQRMARPHLRKRDQWLKGELDRLNERIGTMDQRQELWALRDRLDAMQAQLSGLEAEMDQVRRSPGAPDNPIADLSDLTQRNLVVRFEKASSHLDEQYKVLLSEVFEQLARAPHYRLLITGFSDRSGTDEANMAISAERARAVRAYLVARGIAEERLLVNYYGSSRSLGIDPEERRVEIEWLR